MLVDGTKNSLFKNYKLIIGLSVVFGLLTVYGVRDYTSKKVSLRPTVLVKEDIDAGQQIKKENLILDMKPQGGINSDVLQTQKMRTGSLLKVSFRKTPPCVPPWLERA